MKKLIAIAIAAVISAQAVYAACFTCNSGGTVVRDPTKSPTRVQFEHYCNSGVKKTAYQAGGVCNVTVQCVNYDNGTRTCVDELYNVTSCWTSGGCT